jgi:hypothetical protein
VSKPYLYYQRTNLTLAKEWEPEDDMTRVSVSQADKEAGSPKEGDMIAKNIDNEGDQWMIAKEYFLKNFKRSAQVALEPRLRG